MLLLFVMFAFVIFMLFYCFYTLNVMFRFYHGLINFSLLNRKYTGQSIRGTSLQNAVSLDRLQE